MPLAAELLGEKGVRLFAIFLVIFNLDAVSPLSLSVDVPWSELGFKNVARYKNVALDDSGKNSLIAIVTCNGGELRAQINETKSSSFDNRSLQLELEENGNKPNEFFLLPSSTGAALLPKGYYCIDIFCGNQTAVLNLNVIGPSPYRYRTYVHFTDSPRSVSISAGTPPGTVIANYKAEFRSSAYRLFRVHNTFFSVPFFLNSSSGELIVRRSLKEEGTLPMYDIVVVASDYYAAWTLTTIIINAENSTTDPENTIPRIERFQEVTTVEESAQNVVVFSFDLFTGNITSNIVDRTIFQLRWETVNSNSSGLINLTVTKGRGFKQANHTTDGAVTYHFTVGAARLGEGPLLLTLLSSMRLHCLRYRSYSCNHNPAYWCTCSQWLYEGESETIPINAKKGYFDVVNFRDVTANSDLDNNTAMFEFEFEPMSHLNPSVSFELHLTWSQVSGPSSGVIDYEAVNCRYYNQSNAQLERVRHTGVYRLYVPIHLLGEGRLLANLSINIFCINYQYQYEYRFYLYRYLRQYQCVCNEWQIRGTSDSLEISAKRGTVNIMNFQDITTENDLKDKNAVFAFDTHPKISPDMRFGYSVQIQWSQLRLEFGGNHRTHTLYLHPEGARNCGGAQNAALELIRAGSYKLTVPTVVLNSGPLSISVAVSLTCLNLTSHYCPICTQWRYTSQASSNIVISAKKGSLAPFEVDLELWPKEQCFEAADAIKASDISSVLIKTIRDNADDTADTSHFQVYGERYLCERKGYLTFRGVLVKLYDFLATKNRDILGGWLKGGARHIVVAERQMNIKEGACGIALINLEDTACDKGGRKEGRRN